MADAQGNDIELVGVPLSGRIAIAPFATAIPTPETGADPELALNAAFKPIGLVKKDGGPQLAYAATGDPLDFWQDGYEIPSGLAEVTLSTTAAEILNAEVRKLVAGVAPDVDGYVEVDGGGHATRYVLWIEEIFKSSAIRRRVCPNVSIKSSTEDKNSRGEVLGIAFVFNIKRSAAVGGKHWGEWVLPAE